MGTLERLGFDSGLRVSIVLLVLLVYNRSSAIFKRIVFFL